MFIHWANNTEEKTIAAVPRHSSDFLQIICLEVSSIFRISDASFERERYSSEKVARRRAGRSAGIKISSVSNRGARSGFERDESRETETDKPTTRMEESSSPGLLCPPHSLDYVESSFRPSLSFSTHRPPKERQNFFLSWNWIILVQTILVHVFT